MREGCCGRQLHALSMHPYCIDTSSTFRHSNKEEALCAICYLSPSPAETKPCSEPRQSTESITTVYICSNRATCYPIFLYSVMPCCTLGLCLAYAIRKLKRGSSLVVVYKLSLDSAGARRSCLCLKRLYKLSLFSCPSLKSS